MVVDDAAILGANDCQLESWVNNSASGTEYWAVPACNFSGNLEIALGGARVVEASQAGKVAIHNVAVLQGKTIFKPLDNNGWGAGLVFGTQTVSGHGGIGDVFATVPVSFSFFDGGLLAHANAGLVRMASSRHAYKTWGAGIEAVLNDTSTLTAETFGQPGGKPFVQLGIKYWLTRDRLQLDATYGDTYGNTYGAYGKRGSDRVVTIGLVLFRDFLQ